MLNEEKVRYMTELAIFEKNQGRKMFAISRFFKRDYISGQMFRSFFGYTLSYLLILILWVFSHLESLLGGISFEELTVLGRRWGIWYLVGLVIYQLITRRVSAARYDQAARMQIMYAAKLRHLIKRYKKREKRGGRTA